MSISPRKTTRRSPSFGTNQNDVADSASIGTESGEIAKAVIRALYPMMSWTCWMITKKNPNSARNNTVTEAAPVAN